MPTPFWQLYGAQVRLHRQRKGWSQTQLAGWLGLQSKASISQIESGEVVPSGDKMVEMARLFGVSVSSMLGESAPARPDADTELIQHLCAVFMLVPEPHSRKRILAYLLDAISSALKDPQAQPTPPDDPLLPCAGKAGG